MSTRYSLACVSHDPPVISDADLYNKGGFEALLRLLANRDAFPSDYDYEDLRDTATYENVGPMLRFLDCHPGCTVWIQSEYQEWTDPGGFTHQERRNPISGTARAACTCGVPWPHHTPWATAAQTTSA